MSRPRMKPLRIDYDNGACGDRFQGKTDG
jgi:hypothetical protein